MEKSVYDKMNEIREEILNDDISWRELESKSKDIMVFDSYNKEKHIKGYGVLELTIIHDSKDAFVTYGAGYYKTYKELKESSNIKLGGQKTINVRGSVTHIKFY